MLFLNNVKFMECETKQYEKDPAAIHSEERPPRELVVKLIMATEFSHAKRALISLCYY